MHEWEDVSPAPAAGTYAWSASPVHELRQVTRVSLAKRSGSGPGPGPFRCQVSRVRFGPVGGVPGRAAASMEIPPCLVMPPGHCQIAPQSLGWTRVSGTGRSGVWVLKDAARTYSVPENLDDVGVVWEHRSGYETAPRQGTAVCAHTYVGMEQFDHKLIPPFFTDAVNLWSRVASLMTPWSAQGGVPTEVYLNWYPVRTDHVSQGTAITSVCSVFRLSRRSQ